MRCATSLERSKLVRFVGSCARTRVAIEMYLRMVGAKRCAFERPAQQATKPQAKQEARY